MKLALAAALLLAAVGRAGALDLHDVPADARWFAHLDVEAMAKSKFLAALRKGGNDLSREFDVDELERTFGIVFERDLTSLTLYGRAINEQDTVTVARARTSIEQAWPNIVERCGVPVRILGRDVYVLHQDTNTLRIARIGALDCAAPVFLFATSENALLGALGLVAGTVPNLATPAADSLAARPSSKSIYFASGTLASRRSPFPDGSLKLLTEFAAFEGDEPATLVKLARALTFDLGEEGELLSARLELETADARGASQLVELFKCPLARLTRAVGRTDGAASITRITRALRIASVGPKLTATFRGDIQTFVDDVARAETAMGIRSGR